MSTTYRLLVHGLRVWVYRDEFDADGKVVGVSVMRDSKWMPTVEGGLLGEPTLMADPDVSHYVVLR